ncbi:hypothetical protein PsorP6_014888 [Peronosclerospora sorghi]|uniref:Uncharacterized protein n=1 Tax=Peronosclerospora sorghi TaxID=230839 RepID=A0ACC0VRB1_9STRA|nr:hypothetical protein PsorP6_014888 [Peronosclerospora sorghi]
MILMAVIIDILATHEQLGLKDELFNALIRTNMLLNLNVELAVELDGELFWQIVWSGVLDVEKIWRAGDITSGASFGTAMRGSSLARTSSTY